MGGKFTGGLCPFGEMGRYPSNAMWLGPRPTRMPSFILIRPTVWPLYANVRDRQIDRQDRQTGQWSNRIGRTVLQLVTQKLYQVIF